MIATFTVDGEELDLLQEWLKKHNEECPYASPKRQGAIGGRLTYMFTPTSIGTIATVKCACGEEIDLDNGIF